MRRDTTCTILVLCVTRAGDDVGAVEDDSADEEDKAGPEISWWEPGIIVPRFSALRLIDTAGARVWQIAKGRGERSSLELVPGQERGDQRRLRPRLLRAGPGG